MYELKRWGHRVVVAAKAGPAHDVDGTDTLYDVERLQFADRTIYVNSLWDQSRGTAPGGDVSDGGVTQAGGGASGSEGTASVVSSGATVVGNDSSEYLTGTSGPDVIHGGGGNDVLTGYAGQDTFDGGPGSDTVDYSYQPASVHGFIDLAQGIATFPGFYTEQLTSIENIWMGAGNDQVYGDSGPNDLRGGPGDDVLKGGAGNDVIYGDWKYSDQGGIDTAILSYTFGTGYTISGSANTLRIVGAEGDDWYYNIEHFQFADGITKTATEVLQRQVFAGDVHTITVASAEISGVNGYSSSRTPSITADGRYVAFSSFARNLVPDDTDGKYNIFVKDLQSGSVNRIAAGIDCFDPSISNDGRYVVFRGQARKGDVISGPSDIYLADLETGVSTIIFPHRTVSNFGSSTVLGAWDASISGNGRFAVAEVDSLAATNIVVRDLQTGTDTTIHVNTINSNPSISDDGRYVAFMSWKNAGGGTFDVYLKDLSTGETTLLSKGINGGNPDGNSYSPSISANGQVVAFWSRATNLVTGDTNSETDMFVFDRAVNSLQRLPMSQLTPDNSKIAITADGRYLAFRSDVDNPSLGDSNGHPDVFVYDRETQTFTLASSTNGTDSNGSASNPSMSGDGRFIAFDSTSTNLIPVDINGTLSDVFVTDRLNNRPPIANNDVVLTDQNSPVSGDVLADNGNGADSDPDGNTISVVAVNGVATGVAKFLVLSSGAELIVNPDGRFVYDPNGKFAGLNVGQAASDMFTYTIADGQGHTTTAFVSLTITGTLQGLTITNGSGVLNGTAADDQIAGGPGNETIRGGEGQDWLRGGSGNDSLYGDGGDDILDGGDGDDVIDGGIGFNIAIYAGPRSGYQVILDDGAVHVSGPEGSDTLTNIQQLIFSDGIVLVSSLPPPAATISVAATSAAKPEGQSGTTPFTFTVTRTGDLSGAHSATWVVGGSVVDGADFVGGVLPSGTVTFGAGETSKVITVDVVGDAAVEADESFSVTLSNPSAGATIAAATAVTTILNDDAEVSIATTTDSVVEGNSGITAFTLTLTRSGDTSATQSVSWSVAGTSFAPATASDFAGGVLPSGSVTFGSGEASKIVIVNVQGDTISEFDERFTVTLANASAGLTIVTGSVIGTIQTDDESSVSITFADLVKPEGNGDPTPFEFTVTRTGDVWVSQSVSWTVSGSGSNPASAEDFLFPGGVLPGGTIDFASGVISFTTGFYVVADTVVEPDESFTVSLLGASPGLAIDTASVAGAILNDDTFGSTVDIVPADAVKSEGNSGSTLLHFTVTRYGDVSTSQSVSWVVNGAGFNPANAADFAGGALPSGVVTFAAGETTKAVAVSVVSDAVVEPNEEFTVTLENASFGMEIIGGGAPGTILNDDGVIIAATNSWKYEGDSGITTFTFTVTQPRDDLSSHSVSWAVSGSSTASDFEGGVLPYGVLTFAPGETSKMITVNVVGDTFVEPIEDFTVTLSNLSPGLVLASGSATSTIVNDDIAHDDAYVVTHGQVLTSTVAMGVLSNDVPFDPVFSPVSATLATAPEHGSLQLSTDGSFTYTPSPNFTGVDSFAYHSAMTLVNPHHYNPWLTGNAQATIYVVPVNVGATTTLDLLALTADEQIAATYVAFFGRAADAGGHAFWVGEFVRGLPVQGPTTLFANIASSFGISEEARALYPFLANPFAASDAAISTFLDSVYDNLFNRSSDAGGLAYWTGQIKATLQAGQFVGSVLVNIMSGAQGSDITTLMGKVAVSLEFVHKQEEHHTVWAGAIDAVAATSLLDAVTSDPQSVLIGIKQADMLIAAHP